MYNHLLSKKQIILGVCGGIAAYKSIELLRQITKLGANVKVIMTRNATKFINPITFESLSYNQVFLNLFENKETGKITHINLALEADFVILAPATANIIAKIANGIADDFITTFILAVKCPILICPSMNSNMYENPATIKNLNKISQYGHLVLTCDNGNLACGIRGTGRFPEPSEIIDRIIYYLTPKVLKNKNILVTAGPTKEFIDPVRFISNPSSGKMGYAIARAAENKGAFVTLISGPVNIDTPKNIKTIFVESAKDMTSAVLKNFKKFDIIFKVAAVCDYRSEKICFEKIKKNQRKVFLSLKKNKDILEELGQFKTDKQILVGFAAESSNLISNAKLKLKKKNLDMIVANLIGKNRYGFGTRKNSVTLILSENKIKKIELKSKNDIAQIIINNVIDIINLKKISE